MKLKDEVGMAGPKSTQTRFVGIITSTIHPYACFSCIYWCRLPVLLLQFGYIFFESSCQGLYMLVVEIILIWLVGGGGFASQLIVAWLHGQFIPAHHIATKKASVGMYSGCDYPYKSCLCTFWPCHPYFILKISFNYFLYLLLFFFLLPCGQNWQFISFSNTIILAWFTHSIFNFIMHG